MYYALAIVMDLLVVASSVVLWRRHHLFIGLLLGSAYLMLVGTRVIPVNSVMSNISLTVTMLVWGSFLYRLHMEFHLFDEPKGSPTRVPKAGPPPRRGRWPRAH